MSILTQLELLKKRRTKIIATLGPASSSETVIRQLMHAGANVFRLNMSHGDHATHRQTYELIRSISDEHGEPVAILADLCGPKIRTGRFRDGAIQLETGKQVTVTTRDIEGEAGLIPSQYAQLANDVKPGDRVLLADGTMELRVERVDGTEIQCLVVQGGLLKNHKGINLPGVAVSAPALTDKDREDARFALELGVDFLALSFVRRQSDVEQLRSLIDATGNDTPIIAKIEKPEALEDMEKILASADGIMIARGDLGVELNPEQVPIAQQQLIGLARRHYKPVIVATQMLESMIDNPRPTRAEVADVANAVSLGTDAVMLSGETAVGGFPIEAVRMMDRVARNTEAYIWQQQHSARHEPAAIEQHRSLPVWNAVARATARLSQDLQVRAIVVISKSGMSAATVSSVRPSAPILGLTALPGIHRRMILLWGVIPVLTREAGNENPLKLARRLAADLELATSGEYILLVRGFHSQKKLNTPSVTVLTV